MSGLAHIRGGLQIRYGHASVSGAKNANDDSLGIRIPDGAELTTKGITTVIADGVSSAEAGGEAAQLCVLGLLNDYYSTPDTWGVKTAGQRVLAAINRWLYGEGRRFADECKGYVAAMSALILKSQTAHIFHAGDTRIYRLHRENLEQITNDHSNRVSKNTSYLTRALGLNLNVRIDYHSITIQPGDVFLLTTDGIHDHLSHALISDILLAGFGDPDATSDQLIQAALARGSPDNLSCQIVVVDGVDPSDKADVYRELNRLPFPPDLDPGMVFEGYKIGRLMHASNRSQLYLATDTSDDKKVVLKTPSVNYVDDAAYIDRFVMEEWIGRRLSNRHLIKWIRKRVPEPHFLYHVTEYVEGRSLQDWIECNTQPSVSEVVEMVGGIIRGLRAMHRKEILHGDLKPQNIMIDTEGTPRIIDFGSAHILGVQEIGLPFERSIALGTERYSAPEFKLGIGPTPRSDLFSLAMISYEMLTHGRRPFGETYEKANSIREFSALSYQPAARFNPLIPTWIDGALRRALSWNTANRQPSMSEFLAELKRPNPDYILPADAPLLERNPVAFWKGVSAALFALVVVLLFLLLGGR